MFVKKINMAKEVWKKHPSGLLVSSIGRVKVPKSGKWLEHITYGSDSYGYKQVRYQGKNYSVHRLVAECFIDNPEGKPEVDHINMKKDENMVENLRWATRVEQMNFPDQDVNERRTKNIDYKALAKKRSKPVLQCSLDGNLVKMWPSANECGRNGYTHSAVTNCCLGKRKTHKGYIWRYA